mmetsp:Transcript_109886/g.309937  ORF Transcript_109886/g.309937 Transcript_109886/m.309937 type:complete len:247 (+) Transcript_109886:217-957(+)
MAWMLLWFRERARRLGVAKACRELRSDGAPRLRVHDCQRVPRHRSCVAGQGGGFGALALQREKVCPLYWGWPVDVRGYQRLRIAGRGEPQRCRRFGHYGAQVADARAADARAPCPSRPLEGRPRIPLDTTEPRRTAAEGWLAAGGHQRDPWRVARARQPRDTHVGQASRRSLRGHGRLRRDGRPHTSAGHFDRRYERRPRCHESCSARCKGRGLGIGDRWLPADQPRQGVHLARLRGLRRLACPGC